MWVWVGVVGGRGGRYVIIALVGLLHFNFSYLYTKNMFSLR